MLFTIAFAIFAFSGFAMMAILLLASVGVIDDSGNESSNYLPWPKTFKFLAVALLIGAALTFIQVLF